MRSLVFGFIFFMASANVYAAWIPPSGPVVPGEYIVRETEGQGEGKLKVISAYAVFGLKVVERLDFDNDRLAVVVRVHEDIARFMAATGYDVTPHWEVQAAGTFSRTQIVQSDVSWHLDRIDQRTLELNNLFRVRGTGLTTGAIVLDSSILQNPEFSDRLLPDGKDFVQDGQGLYTDCGGYDTHATGVVSAIAGSKYGVAREVSVVVGRVIGCDGRGKGSAILKGLDWALSYAKAHPDRLWIVNLSFGGQGPSSGYDPLLKKLRMAGVIVVAAAGNDNIDVKGFAPANSQYVLAVGGTNKADQRYSQSNYGKGVVIYAPADGIQTAGGYGAEEIWTGTGTSLAAPQVVGVLALLHEQFPKATSAQLREFLWANATQGVVKNTKTTPGALLYAGPASRKRVLGR